MTGELTAEEVKAAFSEVLRELREERDLTREKLGELSFMEGNYVYLLETKRRQPTLRIMFHLSDALGISLPELAKLVQERLVKIRREKQGRKS